MHNNRLAKGSSATLQTAEQRIPGTGICDRARRAQPPLRLADFSLRKAAKHTAGLYRPVEKPLKAATCPPLSGLAP
ncbi:hypothetical protein D3C78_1622990 [compost metagenome]